MTSDQDQERNAEVIQFILDQIESVPHLEALLLLRSSRPRKWTVAELSKRLYITPDAARLLLKDLAQRKLLVVDSAASIYYYEPPSDEQDRLIGRVDEMYRRQLVRVSQLIHSKPSAAVRDFARAFRLKKDE